MEQTIQFLKQYGFLIAIGLVGCGILIYGVYGEVKAEKPVVEIIKGSEKSDQSGQLGKGDMNTIIVDVAGAVEKPGLYKLVPGSRIGDALVLAGGLSASADREWVEKNVNLAEVLKDGGKLYVPEKSEKTVNQPGSESVRQMNQKVNINTASLSELDTLDGIGEARARSIFDNRPYGDLEELMSKAKIPRSVYENIKTSISIY